MIKEFFRKQKAKGELIKAFRAAKIYKEVKRDKKTIKIYPSIKSVRFLESRTEHVFIMPYGIDPKDVQKNIVFFQQVLGKNIDITTDNIKKVILNVNHSNIPKELKYNFETISELVKDMRIGIVAGIGMNGEYVVFDAIEFGEVNFLVAGEQGSGKSTMLRNILITLICTKKPNELHLYLADLKLSEFHIFDNIEHLKHPICETPAELYKVTQLLMKEVKKRGKLLKQYGIAHVDDLPENAKVPYIGLFIDEIIMLIGEKDILKDLVQIVALGRALGIITCFSLQRPSYDILDTKIRGLLSVRMGFRTTDVQNSKIIGIIGSEKISAETRGRYLLKRSNIQELQAPYITQQEAEKLLKPYKVKEIIEENPPLDQQEEQIEDEIEWGFLDNEFEQ